MLILRELVMDVLRTEPDQNLHFNFSGDYEHFIVPDSYKSILSAFPYLSAVDGKVLNLGNVRSTLQLSSIGEALVRRKVELGVEKSVDALFEFLGQDYNPCIEVILLRGLKVPCTFQLLDDVFIAAPDAVPSPTLKKFLKRHAEGYGALDLMSPTLPIDYMPPVERPDSVLFRLTKVRPKFFDQTDNSFLSFDSGDVEYLKRVSALLTIISPSVVINRRGYSELQDGAFLNGVTPRNWESRSQDAGVGAVHNSTLAELEDFKRTLAAYLALPTAHREPLEVPIHRLNEALRHDNLVDRAIDLGVAMESLLLAGLDDKAQLSLMLRLRGAWLLGRSVDERKAIYSLLKELYNYRSSAAHSGKLSKAKGVAQAEKVMQESLSLCARAIKEIIFRGGKLASSFWDELLLGG